MSQITEIPVDEIRAGDNDRTRFDADALQRLAATIDAHGLAQPITVRPYAGGFEIVAGERRYRAVRDLGWPTIPAIVRELDDAETAAMMLAENTSRVDLDPVDEGRAYAKRMAGGASAQQVADDAGVSVVRVRFRVKLLDLTDQARAMVSAGQLPLGYAEMLHGLDADRQRMALRALATRDLTHAAFRDLTSRLEAEQAAEGQGTAFDLDGFLVTADVKGQPKATRRQLVDALAALAPEAGNHRTAAYRDAVAILAREGVTVD